MDNNCTTDKFKDKNCMGLWEPDKKCKDTDCKYHKNFKEKIIKSSDEAVCHRLAAEQCVSWEGCDSCSPSYKYVKENIQKEKCSGLY